MWPQTTKINSDYNGVLELTYVNGKKMLDSKNANYSYGALQQVLEFGLQAVDFTNVESVLLLGLGGGSAVVLLRDTFNYKGNIVAVEFDSTVITIAKNEFLIDQDDQLQIVAVDAFNYVKNNTQTANLIIVDLFVDTKVPSKFYTSLFCECLYKQLKSNGSILFNIGMQEKAVDETEKVVAFFKEKQCEVQIFEKVKGTNRLLLITKKTALVYV